MNIKTLNFILAAVIFLTLSILLPNHTQPWLSFYQESGIFACLICCSFALLSEKRYTTFKLSSGAIGLLALVLIPIGQYFFGLIDFESSFLSVLFVAGFSFAIALGFQVSSIPALKVALCQSLAVVLLLLAVISVWIALRQWLMLPGSYLVVEMRPGARAFANFGQPNHLATFLCMALAGLIYIVEQKLLGRLSATFLALLILFGVALTQSRTPWLGFFCGLIWWIWQYRKGVVSLSPYIMTLWLAVFALMVILLPSINELLSLEGASVGERFEKAERLTIWTQLLLAIKAGNFWGYGWGQVAAAQLQVALDYPIGMRIDNSHNILLDLLIWNGPVLGSIIILVALLWLLRLAMRAKTVESSFALLFSGFILVHGMVEYPLEYAYFLLPLGLMLGIAEADAFAGTPVNGRVAKLLLGGAGLLGVIMLSCVWIEYRKIEAGFQQMRFDRANIGRPKPWPEESSIILLTQLDARLRAAYIDITGLISDEDMNQLCHVAHHTPYPLELYRCGLAKGFRGDTQGAARELLIIESLHRQRSFMWAYTELQKEAKKTPALLNVLAEINQIRPTIKLQYQPASKWSDVLDGGGDLWGE